MLPSLKWWKDPGISEFVLDSGNDRIDLTSAATSVCSCASIESFVMHTIPALTARYSPEALRINVMCFCKVDPKLLAQLKRIPHVSGVRQIHGKCEALDVISSIISTAGWRVQLFTKAGVDDYAGYRQQNKMQRVLTVMLGCPEGLLLRGRFSLWTRAGLHLLVASSNLSASTVAAADLSFNQELEPPTPEEFEVTLQELEYIGAEHGYTPPKTIHYMG